MINPPPLLLRCTCAGLIASAVIAGSFAVPLIAQTITIRTLDVGSGGDLGQYASQANVNGSPAISYYDNTNFDLKYVRALDASGTTWGTPVTVDSTGDVGRGTRLAVVDGYPAVCYYDATNSDLKFVRALDASGTTWDSPMTLDSTGNVGKDASLTVVNGNPAISYYDTTNTDLKFVRALDASGTTWGTPVTVDSTGNVGAYTSLTVVNGNPAISYYDTTNGDLKYIRATDTNGANWSIPLILDSSGDVGKYTSLVALNGNAAISYFDITNGDLKWATLTFDADNDGLLDSWEETYWPGDTSHRALDDWDKDGYCELLELALGLSPLVPNAGGLPPVTEEGGYLTMTLTKQPGVTCEVQSAGTLPDSFSASTTTVLIDDATTLKVRDNFRITAAPGRFMRLKVTAAP